MDCTNARKLFPGILLGIFGGEVEKEVATHLDSCQSCREWKNTGGMNQTLETVELVDRALKASRG